MEQVWQTNNLNEFESAVGELFGILVSNEADNVVVGLRGDLGAGKTTMSKIIAKKLGVTNDVVSPTFNIMKIYETADNRFKNFVHIDAYRISPDEVTSFNTNLKIQNYLTTPNTLVLIEWPENIKTILPNNAMFIEIKQDFIDPNKRKVSLV